MATDTKPWYSTGRSNAEFVALWRAVTEKLTSHTHVCPAVTGEWPVTQGMANTSSACTDTSERL